jgi:hypothetical protein
MKSWYEQAKGIVDKGQFGYVDVTSNEEVEESDVTYPSEHEEDIQAREEEGNTTVLLDTYTASMLVQIADAVKEDNREHFIHLPVDKAVNLGWKLLDKVS